MEQMRGTYVVLAAAALSLLAPTAVGGVAAGLTQQSVDADVVVMTADIGPDGDARWTIDYRVRLTDDNETQAFEELQTDIRTNESVYTDRFRDRMNRTARAGENATGRQMRIENVSVATAQENFGQSYGVVTYRFRWTNFAATNDTHISAGDALSGLYLDGNTSLTLRWPDDYERVRAAPLPDEQQNGSVTWRGPQSFGASAPRVVAANESGSFADGSGPAPGLVVPLLVGAALAAAGYAAYRYVRADDSASTAATAPADDDGATAETTPVDDGDDTPPPELLSNEEQVMQLLDEAGGRIKQQQVASELDWTAAKTSQVVGGLREDGKLETFRIGRENVVTLPGTDLTADDTDSDTNGDR